MLGLIISLWLSGVQPPVVSYVQDEYFCYRCLGDTADMEEIHSKYWILETQ